MRTINLLPPRDSYQKHVYITHKKPVESVQDVHDFIIANTSDKDKKDTNMFSMIHTESMRYKQVHTSWIWGICLDIDDGISFKNVQDKLDKLKWNYLMYNTHSHGKGGEDRFRCVIVMDKIYSKFDFTMAKPILKKEFIEMFSIDSSTLDINRRFIFPPTKCKLNYNKPPIIVSKVKGKLLNISKAVEIGTKKFKSKQRFEKMEMKESFGKNIKGLVNYINKIEWVNGDKHNTIVRFILKFKQHDNGGWKYDELKQLLINNTNFHINWSLYENLR